MVELSESNYLLPGKNYYNKGGANASLLYLLGKTSKRPLSLRAKYSVSDAVGLITETYIANIFECDRKDEFGSKPDLIFRRKGLKSDTHLEVKASNMGNSIVFKLNQSAKFSRIKGLYYVLVYYRCKNPKKLFEDGGIDLLEEEMEIDSIYVLPPQILRVRAESTTLKKRPKKVRENAGKPTYSDIFIKLSKRQLENFLKNYFDLGKQIPKKVGKVTYMGIDLRSYHGKFRKI